LFTGLRRGRRDDCGGPIEGNHLRDTRLILRLVCKGQDKHFARQLRRSATDAERLSWRYRRGRQLNGHRFRRQYQIGPFFVDFACPGAGLVIIS
jgi:very-short-patch-repair endonuclease